MPIPAVVEELVARFERNRAAYHSGQYNEAQVRQEFINPFWEALGWDVYNRQGYSERYKEVVHEETLKVQGKNKAPDYAFRLGGQRVFFVEAKKPAVRIKDDISPAYQLRRYAWSAKLPLSVLTDFEEFAAYDCRIRPAKTDKASTARVMYLTDKDYAARWDEIADLFAPQAIRTGAFDRYVASTRAKRGTAEVDAAFLGEIERWREALARNIALRNPGLSVRQLNYAVQMTIDRLIFLRISEDRGIEPYHRLGDVTQGGKGIYERLGLLFRQADDRYNSGLFHFRPEKGRDDAADDFTLGLRIDDKVLKEIVGSLYYPDCPYEFSVLPADILGQVYEQFLGKVVRLTPAGRAKVEEKPEVKKAGGVYYTPTYIVDYIVEHTVGRLLAGKTPRQVWGSQRSAPLRVLDPACGSGTFLLQAYQYLLDWYLEQYVAGDPQLHARQGRLAPGKAATPASGRGGPEWRLTGDERKRILLTHIYGLDVDPQAVGVTKLSLLLKVLEEGEGERQLSFVQERALPDLGRNVRCGNSLIGPDYYAGKQLALFDEEEMYRVNAFDWKEGFARAMAAGGFDVVIGNPPYGKMIPPDQKDYFNSHYQHQNYQKDWYLLFLERYDHFLKKDGYLGVIVSNTWLLSVTLRKIRKYLTSRFIWKRVLYLPQKVFKAVVDTHVLVFRKSETGIQDNSVITVEVRRNNQVNPMHAMPGRFIPKNGDAINIVAPPESQLLFRKILSVSRPLSKLFKVFNGVKPFEKGKGKPPQTAEVVRNHVYVYKGDAPDDTWSPLIRGSLIGRYQNHWKNDHWIQYGEWLAAPRDPSIFKAPLKIVVRQTSDSIIATVVQSGIIARNNLHIILPGDTSYKLLYLLGLMNSKFMDFSYAFINPEKGEALAEVKKRHVEQLSIRIIDFDDPADVARHDKVVELVERTLALHEKLAAARTPQGKRLLQQQIGIADREIDRLVYALYGLTEEEIAIMEGG